MKLILISFIITSCICLPSWGTYEPNRIFSMVNINTSQKVQFGMKKQNQAQTTTLVNQVRRSNYLFHDGYNYMQKQIIGNDNQSILIDCQLGSQFSFNMSLRKFQKNSKIALIFTSRNSNTSIERKINQYIHQDLVIESTMSCQLGWSNLLKIGLFDVFEFNEVGNSLLLICSMNREQEKIVVTSMNNKLPTIQNFKQTYATKLKKFMDSYKLKLQFEHIISHALSNTLGSLSFEKSKYSSYITLMSKYSNEGQISNMGLTTFIISILSKFDYELSRELFNYIVERLEDESVYSEDQHFFTVPEYTQIFLQFDHSKSVKILNSIIYKSMFHKVNHMIGHEASDYHSSKQMHPVIRKMLQISWESNFNYLKGQSIYTQSFMDDIYTHSPDQQAEISVSKATWILKTLRILISLNKKSKSISNQQLSTLESNLRRYIKNSCYQKQQKVFKSINKIQRARYFSPLISYQTYFPFIYKLQPKYQQSYSAVFRILKNMTSKRGVVSQQYSKFDSQQDHNFRGRIWPYYNYKIVQMMRTPQDLRDQYIAQDIFLKGADKIQQILLHITGLLQKVKTLQSQVSQTIVNFIKNQILSDWEQKKDLFSSWTVQGKVFDSNPELILVNTLFLN